MIKIDFKKQEPALYKASAKNADLVIVPKMNFLMIDGEGYPGSSSEFITGIQALYPAAYTLKFMAKGQPENEGFFDYVVPPLEALWWMNGNIPFDVKKPDEWRWTLMIRQPDFVTPVFFRKAVEQVQKKKNPPALPKIRLESLEEGKSVQMLHIGSYQKEEPTLKKMQQFAEENNLSLIGKHHEIYLNDPGRVPEEKLKTILRNAVK